MKRYAFGFVVGLAVVAGSSLLFWLLLPLIFSAITNGPDAWLGWFPFVMFIPALLLGGYCSARLVPVRRVALGFAVGLAATAAAGFILRGSGKVFFLIIAVVLGGILSAAGAKMLGNSAIAP